MFCGCQPSSPVTCHSGPPSLHSRPDASDMSLRFQGRLVRRVPALELFCHCCLVRTTGLRQEPGVSRGRKALTRVVSPRDEGRGRSSTWRRCRARGRPLARPPLAGLRPERAVGWGWGAPPADTEGETHHLGLKPGLRKVRGSVHTEQAAGPCRGTRLITQEERVHRLMPARRVLPTSASPAEAAGSTPASPIVGKSATE